MNIHFTKANHHHIDIIFNWLKKPHMRKFWDNSQEHKDDILNFIHGKEQNYFYGTAKYWVGSLDQDPFSFIVSDIILETQNLSDLHKKNLSKSGHTITLDFGIGNKKYLGKGLSAITLQKFTSFYHDSVDLFADTFFIDPSENNSHAQHVYHKAGFKHIGTINIQAGAFKGDANYLMVKTI